jgi:predicted enzyme related to lactoylglutathione lyase
MNCRLVALAVDANDPPRLARFWEGALRWKIEGAAGDEIGLMPTDDTGFHLVFRAVKEPKTAKNPIHLDLTTASIKDQTDSVEQLLDLGASHIDVGQGPADQHVVLADPEGNEFCLIEPTNKFLAGCGRLGSITCDGSRDVGVFWSAVFGWPLVWDQDGETAIRERDGGGAFVTWGPPVPPKRTKSRLHLEIAPLAATDRDAEVRRLVSLGATRIAAGRSGADRVELADPDGIEFRLCR